MSLNFRNFLKKHLSSLMFLFFLVLIAYANSLNNVFLSDDLAEIAQKPEIANFSRIFQFPFGPIRHFIYWIDFQTGGLNPAIFRLSNILLHLGNSILVYLLLILITKSKKIAFFTASIFAVHPAIAEGVVWISGGMYPQYTFFFLLSLLFYILSAKSKKFYYFSILFFLFSFMSHQAMPMALVFIFPLYEFCFGDLKKNWKKSIPYFFIPLIYFIRTLIELPSRETTLQTVHYQERGIDNLFLLIPVAISSYLELIFFPKNLTLYHSELDFGPFNFAIRALITLIFFGILILSYRKNKYAFFFLSLLLLGLAPTLTPFRLNWIVAERYLYLPIIGILALVGLGISKLVQLKKFRSIGYLGLIIILSLLSIRTILRNIDWKNEDNLWIATGKTSPSSPNTHNNLGDVYGRWGLKEKSLQEFQTAIALKPNYADAYHNAGNVYREMGNLDKALEYYQKAAQINPNLWQSYQNIAAIHFSLASQEASKSAEEAAKEYNFVLENIQKAIQISPQNINLRINLGIVYLAVGQKDKAKEIFSLVLSVNPQNQLARAGLAESNK